MTVANDREGAGQLRPSFPLSEKGDVLRLCRMAELLDIEKLVAKAKLQAVVGVRFTPTAATFSLVSTLAVSICKHRPAG